MSSSDETPEVLAWHADDQIRLVADCYSGATDRVCLLLHGFWRGRAHPQIIRIAKELALSGRTVIVPDLRGHGDSGGRFTFNRLEWNDLRPLALPEDLVVVGLSMGGAIAISAAAAGVIRPVSMLLISPAADFHDIGPDLLEMFRGGHVAPENRRWTPRIDFRSLLSSVDRPSPSRDAARLRCPLHVVHARGDWLVHHRHGEVLSSRCAGAKLDLLDEVSGRRMHADRLVDHAWPIFRSLFRGIAG